VKGGRKAHPPVFDGRGLELATCIVKARFEQLTHQLQQLVIWVLYYPTATGGIE